MMKKYKLGDCISMIRNGASIKQYDGCKGVPITRIETLANGRFNRNRMGYADVFDTTKYADYILQENDLLMSHINSRAYLGRCVQYHKINDETIIHGMNLLRIITNPQILDSTYAYYFFKTPYFKQCVDSIRIDAVNQSSFNMTDLCQIYVYLPEKAEQLQIAKVLSTIDKKIELNRLTISNLEALARQLYDYWFVQFDFPDANGKPYKSSGGKMVYNEKLKRDIPEGWDNGFLIDIANITMGQSPDGKSYNEEGNGILFYQGSTDFGDRFPDVRQYTTEPSRFAKKGDILMSVRAPVGALNIANNDCCIGRGLASLNSKLGSITHLYYVMLSFKDMFDRMSDVGTTFGAITKDELHKLPVVKPNQGIIKLFEEKCKPIFDQQMILGEEIVSLTRQRDELLPLLMNGQVSVE